MFKRNHLYTSLIAATMLAGTSVAYAVDVTTTASVTVQNAFELTKSADLSFGTLRVTNTLGTGTPAPTAVGAAASVNLPSDGTAMVVTQGSSDASGADGVSQISVITEGTPAQFAIANAAQNTRLTLTLPADGTVALSSPLDRATDIFEVTFVANEDVTIVAADGTETPFNGINFVTDATGALGFKLGGTLTVADDAFGFGDGDYDGDFTVSVNY
ncbi:DUF4402 domain-containing protein [Ningiella sp. W23]|uniref:DUF4402 domain-containing protein n=1 Tax=Ningiella sp. W23 TaxID=3023715 RepID=UPI0037577921